MRSSNAGKGSLFYSIIVFVIVIFLSFVPVKKQSRIHLLFFGDTENSDISQNISAEKDLFEERIPVLLENKSGLQVLVYFFCGKDFNREKVDSINQLFNSNEDDIILFYYSGHGSNDSLSSFPRLAIRKQNGARKNKYLHEIYDELKHKPHRLLVVAGEACNTHSRSRSAQCFEKNFRDSLLAPIANNEKGTNFLITSSKQGQDSYACRGEAGYFTLALLDVLNEVDSLRGSAIPDYLEMWMEKTKYRAASVSDEAGKRLQEPFWVSER